MLSNRLICFLGGLVILLCAITQSAKAQDCDLIEVYDLRFVPGFAQTDSLVVCGAPDTLALLIFTASADPLQGLTLTAKLPEGMQYAGFEESIYANTSVSLVSASDPQNPEFLLSNLDQNASNVVYIGVQADCDYSFSSDLQYVDYEISYIDPSNNYCEQVFNIEDEFDGAFATPVLNINPNITPQNLVFQNFGETKCQTVRISQDGFGAYVDNMELMISGVQLGNGVSLASIAVNGNPYTGEVYDPSTLTYTIGLDDSYFPGNTGGPTVGPADNFFNENEIVSVEVCYNFEACPETTQYFMSYQATYGCQGQTCSSNPPTQVGSIKIQPNFGADPAADLTLIQEPGLCGDLAIFEWTLDVPNPNITNEEGGILNDLEFMIRKLCSSNIMQLQDVTVGNTILAEGNEYTYSGDTLYFDFNAFVADPDGTGLGLEDADGDGLFNDLPYGNEISGTLSFEVLCQDGSICETISCAFDDYTLAGKRHCGNPFDIDDQFSPSPSAIIYGVTDYHTEDDYATDIFDETRGTAGPGNTGIMGFDFGHIDFNQSGVGDLPAVTNFGFAYTYTEQNITGCSSAHTYLEMTLTGNKRMNDDYELLDGTLTFDGVPYSNAAAIISDSFPNAPADSSKRVIVIDLGSSAPGRHDYSFDMALDDCLRPVEWGNVNFRVLQECLDAGCPCETVVACESFVVQADYEGCGPGCRMITNNQTITRTEYGMSCDGSAQLDESTADNPGFAMQCDSMEVHACYEVRVPLVMDRMNLYLYFYDPSTGFLGRMDGLNSYPDVPTEHVVTYYDNTNNLVTDLSACNTSAWTSPGARTNPASRTRQYLLFHDSSCFGPNGNNLNPGDSICIDVKLPIRATIPADDGDNPNFRSFIYVSELLPDGKYFHAAPCAEYDPIKFHDPVVTPNTTFDVNDCFIDVTHTLSVGALPPNWYEDEYRVFDLIDSIGVTVLGGTFYEPGSAQVIQPDGTVYDIVPDYSTDVTCASAGGNDYCFSDLANEGKLYFSSAGMSPAAAHLGELGIGCGSSDVLTFKYRLGIACPLTPDYTGFEWQYYEVQSSCEGLRTANNFDPINNTSAPSPLDGNVSIPVLISSGGTEFNEISVCNNAANSYVHENVGTTISLPYNIALESAIDINSGAAYSFTLVESSPSESIYMIDYQGDLAPGECWEMDVETRLLFCPSGVPTAEIALSIFSGCLSPDVRAALNASGFSADACAGSEVSYLYTFVPSDLQLSLYDEPTPPVQLCEEFSYTVLIKNVKEGRNGNQFFDFYFPAPGVEPVAGTWEIAYPYGPGNPTAFQPFITEPTSSSVGAYGTQITTNIEDVHAWLADNGIPGVFEFNAESTDSNKLAIRFTAKTNCEGFTSGTPFRFNVLGYDACGFETPGSLEISQPLVVEGADPEDFAQFVSFADPLEVNCEGASTISVSAVNLSQTTESDTQSTVKLVLPPGVDYVPGTIAYNTPAGFVPTSVSETQYANGQWEILMEIPAGLGEAELFNFSLQSIFDPASECGNYPMQISIRSQVDGIECIETGELCTVFVEQGRNSIIDLSVVPALALSEFAFYDECSGNPDEVSISYDLELENIGQDYTNRNVTVNIYQDIDANGLLDPAIDPLLGSDQQLVSVPSGEFYTFSSAALVPAVNACPLLTEIVFDSSCECNTLVQPIDDIKPAAVQTIGSAIGVCDANGIDIPYCDSFSHFFLGQDFEELILSDNGDGTINIAPTPDFVGPAIFGIQATYGICATYSEGFGIYNLANYEIDLGPDLQVCQGECSNIEFEPPFEDLSQVEIVWSPDLYLDNTNSTKVEVCPETNVTYTVTMTFPGGCVFTDEISVEALDPANVAIETGATTVCASGAPVDIIATAGFSNYTFFVVNPAGPDLPVQAGTSNVYQVTSAGQYYVKASSAGICPGTSAPWEVIEDPCYACLGDNTWIDCNDNGIFDTGEDPLPGVQVALYNADGTYEGSTVTNGVGYYLFDQVPPNESYYLIFTAPSGLTYTVAAGVIEDNNNNDADPVTGQTGVVSVGDNECLYYLDAGYTPSDLPGIDESNFPEICQGDPLELCVTENWAAYQWYQAADPLSPDPDTDASVAGSTARCFEPITSGTYYAVVEGPFCELPTPTIDVIVHPLPVSTLTASGPTTFCEGEDVLLTAAPAGAVNYDFILDGTTLLQTGSNNTYTANQSGDYTVVVTDANGCSAESTDITIVVHATPEPAYILNGPTTFCEPGVIRVIVDSGYTNYIFYLDGVQVQSGSTAYIDVSASATVAVEVTDVFGCIGFIDEIDVIVLPEPVPFVYANGPSTFCEGDDVLLTIIGAYATYQWYKDGQPIPGAIASIYTATEAGNYSVFVDDLNGCSGTTADFEVIVNPVPDPVIVAPAGYTACEGDGPVLLEAAAGFENYDWYLNGVLLMQSGSSNTFASAQTGIYSVEVRDSNSCEAQSLAVQVEIFSLPTVDVDAADIAFCEGESTQLTASGGLSYSWTPVDGSLSCTDCPNPVASPTLTTTYTVTVTDANACSSSDEIILTVYEAPVPSISFRDAEICEGSETEVFAAPGYAAYVFYHNGIVVQQGIADTYVATVAGDYFLEVTTADGCTGLSEVITLIVNPLPEVSLTSDAPIALCPGEEVTLLATDGFLDYNWFFDGQLIPTETSASMLASTPGTYTVEVTDQNFCTSITNELEITAEEDPDPVILVQGSDTACSGEEVVLNVAGQFASIQWYQDGMAILGAASPVHLATAAGAYTVEVTTAAGCIGTSSSVFVSFHTELMPDILLIGENPKCIGSTVQLNMGYSNFGLMTWYHNGIEVQSGYAQTYEASAPGTYSVIFEDANGCTGQTTELELLETGCTFDLALTKTLASGQSSNVSIGEDVDYTITIYNQGDMDAHNVQIIDYIPSGFVLNDGNWMAAGANATYDLPSVLLAGQSTTVDITLTATADAATGSNVNFAEISQAETEDGEPGADVDSTPDSVQGNDGPSEDNDTDNTNGDEDDHDPAEVILDVFDLALAKTLAVGQSSVVSTGDDVTYTITVYNQGTVDAYNVDVIDYLPTGLQLNDVDWAAVGNNATITLDGPIAAGGFEAVDITVTVTSAAGAGDFVNYAEISDAEDEEGNHPQDTDSTADTDQSNDAGGEPNTESDDSIDGDGTGSPGEENDYNDEDDHDPATVTVATFDLALSKTLAQGQTAEVSPGDDVTFLISVYNQGSIEAYNVDIIDYIPAGFTLNDPDWTASGANAEITIPGPIAGSGGFEFVEITLTVLPTATVGELVNYAEITDAEDENGNHPDDEDSIPDSDSGNDAGGNPGSDSDNEIGGNGSGNPGDENAGTDEDDHDPEVVSVQPVFDLALTKSLADGQSSVVGIGDDVTFTITVYNQGNVTAQNVDVIDYLPTGMVLNDADWTAADDHATTTIAGPIAAGASADVDITVTVVASGDLVNFAEISDAEDGSGNHPEDIDSSADTVEDNDGPVTDDATDNTDADEDDHDPASVSVEENFDLALTKTLAEGQASPVSTGDDVTFTITVYNQGAVDAYNVDVIDYLPTGLVLNDADWTAVGANALITLAGPISTGGFATVDITTTVTATAGSIVNVAEISDAEDEYGNHPEDTDSSSDSNSSNDAGGDPDSDADDAVDGDGSGAPGDDNPSTDEDDSDPAVIELEEIFDLALTKSLAAGQSNNVNIGDDVTYTITVYNQGNADAYNVSVIDYIPAGLLLNDTDWIPVPGAPYTVISGPIAAGGFATVDITLTVTEDATGELVNYAEISDAENADGEHPNDVDSTPDGDSTNDAGGNPGGDTDDAVGGDGSGNPGDDNSAGDEDDHDPASVTIDEGGEDPVFDLALTKTLAPGQPATVAPGSDVSYLITVYNQGDIEAYNVEVVDYIPSGLSLNDSEWTASGPNAVHTIAGPIAPGGVATLEVTMTVSASSGELVNYAEISDAEDQEGNHPVDADSTADTNDSNDAGGASDTASDNSTGGDGSGAPGDESSVSDEDDHDPASVVVEEPNPNPVFDLALNKILAPGESSTVITGQQVTFLITVYNQGTADVQEVEIIDYLPTGLELADSDWTAFGSHALITLPGTLEAGSQTSVEITVTVVATDPGDLTNIAEIMNFEDEFGNHPPDVDSDPDGDPNNDGQVEDDSTDNTNGDEDDHDPAVLTLEEPTEDPVFDLALVKALPTGQSSTVEQGDQVTFLHTVYNQGNVPAYNIDIVDYVPAGLQLDDSDWTETGGQAFYTMPGPIPAGGSGIVAITFIVTADSGSITNTSEIADAEDMDGNHPEDVDSTPDNDPDNEGPVTDGSTDNTDGDEDDSDPETIDLVEQTFDLALTKTLANGQSSNVSTGDDVTFLITVFNQGSIDAYNIELVDYIPSGLSLSDSDWTEAGGMAVYSYSGPLTAGSSVAIPITFTVEASTGSITNIAEITDAEDEDGNHPEDIDSTADPDPDNDGPATDDSTDNTNGDEDDSDPETITIGEEPSEDLFDLALIKTLAAGQSSTVNAGDDVTFLITVFNQGSIDAYNIELVDYIPSGLSLSDSDWTEAGGMAVYSYSGPLTAGSSVAIPITFTVEASTGSITNIAEITDAEDEDGNHPEDIDSTPDSDPDNDGPVTDDSTDNTNGDEDDSDPETITIEEEEPIEDIFDLALIKQLASGQSNDWMIGDEVSYLITVINQGDIAAYNVEISDYLGAGLQLNDAAWTSQGNTASMTIAGPIEPGSSIAVPITCTITEAGDLTNTAEISDAEDVDGNHPQDEDSNPDSDPDNDGLVTDDSTDNTDGDEDDHDPETITVDEPVFDLALTKTMAEGQTAVVSVGNPITFTITVYNQGDLDAYNVEILDQIPAGLQLADGDWSEVNGAAVAVIPGPIAAGTSQSIDITFAVMEVLGEGSNFAEIADAEDEDGNHPEDQDSTPDGDPNNDGPSVNDDIDNTDGDEDDSDTEDFTITEEEVFDLALMKSLADGQSALVSPGDQVHYTITVFNQGNVDAYNVSIIDYLPSSFSLADANWQIVDGYPMTIIPGPIVAGQSATVDIQVVLDELTDDGALTNYAEITAAEDVDGSAVADIDSTPDADSDNDGDVKDDEVSGADGDEDDHDFETLEIIKEVADLSINKSVNDDNPANGDQVIYTLTVNNAGPSPATGVVVSDVLPAGLQFISADSPDYDYTSGRWELTEVNVGQTAVLNITVEVTAVSGSILNMAEVVSADQQDPNSTPNNNAESPDPQNPTENDEDISIIDIDTDDPQTGDPMIDLSLTKLVSDSQPQPGDLIIYSLLLSNDGEADATGVSVTDMLPDGVSFVATAQDNYDPNTGIWTVGSVSAGNSILLEILVEVTAASGTIVNFAEVTAADQEDSDSSPDNGDPNADPSGLEDDEDIAVINLFDCTLNTSYEVICDSGGEFYTVIVAVTEEVTVSGDYEGQVEGAFQIGPVPSGMGFNYTLSTQDGCIIQVVETPTNCVKLAVELLSFDGEVQEHGNLLNWITASEQDAASFTLSRSLDGQHFSPIHSTAAQGISNSEHRYEHFDEYTIPGNVYYKLTELDINGTHRDLGIILLSRSGIQTQILSISPQPATAQVEVTYSYHSETKLAVELYDAAGSLLFAADAITVSGINKIQLDMSPYSPGVYLLKLSGEEDALLQKVIRK